MTRVLAVLAAAALIVGAIVVRNVVLDGGDDDTGRDGPSAREQVVVCATELRAACDDIEGEVRVEDVELTAAALGSGTVDLDVWIALSPWPGIVDDARARAGLDALFDDVVAVARSPLVIVGPTELDGCDWRCLGDRAGPDLMLGGRPLTSGVGTLHLGALATGYFGTNDFAANDFDGTFASWLTGVAGATEATPDPVTRLLLSRAFFDAALSHEVEATSALAGASEDRRAGLVVAYPQPMAYLVVVVATAGGSAGELARDLGDALAGAGWHPADVADGLPRPGVLVALRELV